jgi:ankyrin repeat protein
VSNGLNGSADDASTVPESKKERVDEFRRKFTDLPAATTSIKVESTSPNKHLVDYKDESNRAAVPGHPTTLPTTVQYPAPNLPPAKSNLRKRLSPEEEDLMSKWNELRKAAATANIKVLQSILESDNGKYKDLLHRMDDNHWQILHEAVRVGSLKCVRYLVTKGANPYTILKNGGTALTIAKSALQQGHPVLAYLLSLKVPDIKVSF